MSEGMVVWMYRGYSWKSSITISGHSVNTLNDSVERVSTPLATVRAAWEGSAPAVASDMLGCAVRLGWAARAGGAGAPPSLEAAAGAASTYDDGADTRAGQVATKRGVAIKAAAGNLLLFWSRHRAGIDERSWHGGEAVPHESSTEKWAVTKFKEIPKATYSVRERCEAFVARSRDE